MLKSTEALSWPVEENMAAAPTVSIKVVIAPTCQFPSLSCVWESRVHTI